METSPVPNPDGQSTVPASLEPVNGVFTKDVTIDPETKLWARLFVPVAPDANESSDGGKGDSKTDGVGQMPVILFYQGGGFTMFSADSLSHQGLCKGIARGCQAVVVNTNYRKAPEFPCPTAYDDSYKALEWLRSPESKAFLPAGADVSRCFFVGDSAGGNIAHFMGCRAAAAGDISPVQIRGIVELQPGFGGEDLTPAEAADPKSPILTLAECHDSWAKFLPGHDRDHPYSNVFGPNSPDISGLDLPPILVITGSLDILIDRQVSYVQKLQSMGKDVTMLNYDKADHAFYAAEFVDYGNQRHEAMENVYRFIRSHAAKA